MIISKPRVVPEFPITEDEYRVLKELCKQQDLTQSALLRQALRMYQLIDHRMKSGYTMEFLDKEGKPYPTFSKLNLNLNDT